MTLSEYIKKHYKIALSFVIIFISSLLVIFYLQLKVEDSASETLSFRSDEFKNAFFKAMYHVDFDGGAEQGVWKYISPSKKGNVLLAFKNDVFRVVLKTRGSNDNETVVFDVSGRYKINGGAVYFIEPGVSEVFNSQAVILIPTSERSFEVFCDGQPSLIFNKVKSF
ncbi:hypothetical protein [Aeromonas hydrophila]|uniref:hypothetical protein n=1 Tax=Aeromonas hydrophila TaxID=644 RepID=UPI002B47BA10|nr:hypothetical protein [Aeromonas hydrophila]